jgi:hypothetical protein
MEGLAMKTGIVQPGLMEDFCLPKFSKKQMLQSI